MAKRRPKPTVEELRAGDPWLRVVVHAEAFQHREDRRSMGIVVDRRGRETVVDGEIRIPLPDDGSPIVPRLHEGRGLGHILRMAAAAVVQLGPARLPALLGLHLPAALVTALQVLDASSPEERVARVIADLGSQRLQEVYAAYVARAPGGVSPEEAAEILAIARGERL